MMIDVSVANLLTSVADLLQARKGSWFEFVGADSSFIVIFGFQRLTAGRRNLKSS
jgi:hypothetical protein